MQVSALYFISPETRVIGLHFLSCMYRSIFIQICAVGSKNASFLHRFGFWPFKVAQGHPRWRRWFWYQSKARMRLPIRRPLWLWCYLAPFLRYGDLLAKNCLFFLPLSHSAPSLPMFPLEFCGEVNRQENRVIGLSSSEDCMIVAGVVLAWYRTVTDRRSDRIYHS